LQGRFIDALAALLILSDEPGEIPQVNLRRPVDERCLQLISGIFKRVTTSQFDILGFLRAISGLILKYGLRSWRLPPSALSKPSIFLGITDQSHSSAQL
jgi:hypothetical protein